MSSFIKNAKGGFADEDNHSPARREAIGDSDHIFSQVSLSETRFEKFRYKFQYILLGLIDVICHNRVLQKDRRM